MFWSTRNFYTFDSSISHVTSIHCHRAVVQILMIHLYYRCMVPWVDIFSDFRLGISREARAGARETPTSWVSRIFALLARNRLPELEIILPIPGRANTGACWARAEERHPLALHMCDIACDLRSSDGRVWPASKRQIPNHGRDKD